MTTEYLYIANSKKLEELVPEARWAAQCWLSDCFALGRPFTVSEVFRTTERQKALYAQGRTKPGPIVTERDGVTNLSEHQTRLAADIYPNCSKKDQNAWWIEIADIGRKYGVKHPYTKGRFIDLPHFTFSDAKQKPEPSAARAPASLSEAIRKLERQLQSKKPGAAYDRLKSRLADLQAKK